MKKGPGFEISFVKNFWDELRGISRASVFLASIVP
jgi:hypothetical protein